MAMGFVRVFILSLFIAADRFMYLPSLGFCFLLGKVVDLVWMKRFLRVCLVVILIGLAVKAYQQTFVWKDSLSLWRHQMKSPLFYPFFNIKLADALIENEKEWSDSANVREAIRLTEYVLTVSPHDVEAHMLLGRIYLKQRKWAEAEAHFKKGLLTDKVVFRPHFYLSKIYLFQGKIEESEDFYQIALQKAEENKAVFREFERSFFEEFPDLEVDKLMVQ